MSSKMASGRGRTKAVKNKILKEAESKKDDTLNTLKNINLKENNSTEQKKGKNSKRLNKIANVDDKFVTSESVKKITEFFKSDETKHRNDKEKEKIQSKENVKQDNLTVSKDSMLVKGAGKTRNAKNKAQETEVSSDKNSERVVKTLPKRGRKKVSETNTNMTLQESQKRAIANVEEKSEIPTSKQRKIKSSKNKKKLSSGSEESTDTKSSNQSVKENIERNEEPKKKPRLGRKIKDIEQEFSLEVKESKSKYFSEQDKVLKVVLKRNKTIDELYMQQVDEDNKLAKTVGGAKQPKAGKRARSDDKDTGGSGEKPAKAPKKESKGQSKKDKMPDVSLLDFKNDSTTSDGKNWNLKLSSWNVNGVRAWLEKDGLNFLKHEAPDIMCFQETKCSDEQLPKAVNVEGYHSFWLAGDKDGYSGVGLLSKAKPISVKYGIDIEDHDKEGRVITAEYDSYYLVTAYVPNAGRGLVRLDYRMKWDEDFRLYLKKLDEKKPVILCGDLNVAHEEIDLANPKTNKKNAGFTKEEREGFSVLLSEGFIDSFRYLYPDQKAAYTFWTYMMNARSKNVGWRLDYFLISKRFVDHLCDNVIRKDVYGSDHCPITLFLSV